ncbi:DUF4268 domain-containing protein [Flavobacterium aciduliphilum]|uniref:Uncharacterized protein DUF4268 n=1 Tax=Flavobacterium aciduliphilum TaxID=1101402 RepID=A0A328YAB7_9FLAO|nr:DUF4268 domain-containing protein [Flavobacterium aciduliphilum]RAR70879.1 uncharacterized protein DUF4268 [Flavobacterium aciduliphilum]
MFSKEENQRLKKEFWIQFAESYPRKWILYNTKIKDVVFKFYADTKKAQVILDIEPKEEEKRTIYFEKIESLKNILMEDYLPDVLFEKRLHLDNGKIISRIWVELDNITIKNKESWPIIFEFFEVNMSKFERFFFEYEDYIRDLDLNT